MERNLNNIIPQPLAKFADGRHCVYLTCTSCWRTGKVDVAALVAAEPNITFVDLARRGRCTACGSREVKPMLGHTGQPMWADKPPS